MKPEKKRVSLLDRISDERNIFSAIYSVGSYVHERGLLNTEKPEASGDESQCTGLLISDLELYYALGDKYNTSLIENVITICKNRLTEIFTKKEELFEARVFFKLKEYDDGLKFRPIHTASLIDQICMVCILNCLMFEDDYDANKRYLSDLAKLLPHNFYGNVPCTDVRYLFHKWQTKYKEYTENVIEHCRQYQKDHTFRTEIRLDIKNFFPSVSPIWLYNIIVDKCSLSWKEDIDVLKTAVSKLLFFKLEEENIKPWIKYYYPDEVDGGLYLNCGIPQGLPQSYFFGNLCMMEVKKIIADKECFPGDSYYYVDDSVIYYAQELDQQSFETRLRALNELAEEWCVRMNGDGTDIEKHVAPKYLKFHKQLSYKISFHTDGKSTCAPIGEVNANYELLYNLSRETSLVSKFISSSIDEIDDVTSFKKINALIDVVERLIENSKPKLQKASGKDLPEDLDATNKKTKLQQLKRLKKFFLFRKLILTINESHYEEKGTIKEFEDQHLKLGNVEEWFEQNEENIFQSEYQLIIQNSTKNAASKLVEDIQDWEILMLKKAGFENEELLQGSLFYSKDTSASYYMKSFLDDSYMSLKLWAKENFNESGNKSLKSKMKELRDFLSSESSISLHRIEDKGFDDKAFTKFIVCASSEYKRKIINVFFSELIGIIPSDALTFVKENARRCNYTELRIIAYIRNKYVDIEAFKEFAKGIDENEVSNKMGIDMGLLEVVDLFIKNVRRPDWVDSLICTHRVTKGLWYNGSKFLNSYTLHNEEHAVTLIRRSIELINRIDYFSLRAVDFYILFLSAYLHDVSMVIHPDLSRLGSERGQNLAVISGLMLKIKKEVGRFSLMNAHAANNTRIKEAGNFLVEIFNEVYGYFENEVRSKHAFESATFIRDRSKTLLNYLEPAILSFVANVSESHGYDVWDVYGLKSRAKDDTVSIKYLMMIIRLADSLDVANDRVNYYLLRENLKNLSKTSRFHWISHLVTDNITLLTNYSTPDKKSDGLTPKIEETINLNINVNIKQLTTVENRSKCSHCSCSVKEDHIKVEVSSKNDSCCTLPNCPVLCRWMMKKHEWLIAELAALKGYLESVNYSLFQTRVNFNIYYRNDMNLDQDMLDDVQEFLLAVDSK